MISSILTAPTLGFVISFTSLLVVGIALFGIVGAFQGLRAAALTTGAIFFGLVAILIASGIVSTIFRKLGLPINSPGGTAILDIFLFIFCVVMGSIVFRRIIDVPLDDVARRDRLWGLFLGLINGFLFMAVIEHFIARAAAATQNGSTATVGIPSLIISHPQSNRWVFTIGMNGLSLLPAGSNSDLWAKLPLAILLLLLFLGFVFIGSLYGRLSRST